MVSRRTLLTLAVMVGTYAILWLPAAFSPKYLDSPVGLVAAAPFLSAYLFDLIGIPGLLENHGACGWGWCTPTGFGWGFVVFVWLLVAWLIAWRTAVAFPGRGIVQKGGASNRSN